MDKKFVAAAGATVTSAAFQLSTVVWPDWIKHHTPVVWMLWGIAAILWAWWTTAHLMSTKSGETKPFTPPPSVHAPINVQVNPVFNNNPTIAQSPIQVNEQTAPPSPPQAVGPQRVYLEARAPDLHPLRLTRTAFHIALPGGIAKTVLGAIAWVHYPTAEEGQSAPSITNAVASLLYRLETKTIAVPTACWIEQSGFETDFRAGSQKGILIGLFPTGFSRPTWVAAECKIRRMPDFVSSVTGVTPPNYVEFGWPTEIEISIVSRGHTHKKFTVFVHSASVSHVDLSLERLQ